tara:strand:+ start:2702 stop:3154 length:453 start_codon:yes stop_codon:yes gene_type:complete
MIKRKSIKTKFGWLTAYENNEKIFKISFKKVKKQTQSKTLSNFRKNLLQFLRQKNPYIQGSFKITGNEVQKKVWKELKRIRPGFTKSYGEIAKKYNLSPRHVGKICAQNKLPLAIPCHRVVRTDGTLGGFSADGGLRLKKKLLMFEESWK